MTESKQSTLSYRVLRYTPNLVRDEWVNVGIILEDRSRQLARARLIQDEAEFIRVHRLHPNADDAVLRSLPDHFQAELAATGASSPWLERISEIFSNVLQLSEPTGVMGENLDATIDQLYHDKVAVVPRATGGAMTIENTRAWIRSKLDEVFARHRILGKMEKGIRAEQFTQQGDPMRIDYGYRLSGTHGYLQALSLARDPGQAKVLAYTAACIRARDAHAEFAVVTDGAPSLDNPRQQFIVRLFEEQKISVVPLSEAEMFAERLRMRLP